MIQAVRPQVEDLGKQYSFTLLGKTLEEVTPQQEPREDHKANSITNNIPSTPTSLKGSRSGLSDLTKDTTPSSVEDNHSHHSNNTIQKNIYHDAEIDPLHIPESSNSTIKPLQDHAPKPLLSRVSSSNFPANSDQPVLKSTLQPSNSKPLVQIAPGSEASMSTDRRHTTPNDRPATLRNSIELSRKPRQPTHPISRSTFPLLKHSRPDSSRAEMIRMRNSLINKKGNQKKKKDHFDDDNVLVGNKISEGHENFVMAYNMLTGIRVAVSRCAGIMKRLDEEDFKTTKKLSFNLEGNELTPSSKYDFKFKDYSPEVFRELRSLFGLDPADYLVSITGKYILSQLGSPGKSGSFFYYSRDYRYIIKTIHHSEHKQLRKILKEYYNFVKQNPNTLVCQFYGLHRVKMPFTTDGTRKVHFVVMNNLFPPHRDIHLKYDLKGSSWGRKTKVEPNTDISTYTLKDNNYLEFGQKINFGPSKRKIFFEQLEKDVKFLKKINVMDYSLLLGIHDVKKGNSFDLSQKLAVFDPKSANKSEIIRTNPRDINPDTDLPSGVYPGRLKYIFYGHDGGIRSTTETNDPSSEIYYMGIIDCLTNYSIKKRLETLWRSIGHSRSTISSVPSKEYGDRFYNFIVDGTCKIKRKFD